MRKNLNPLVLLLTMLTTLPESGRRRQVVSRLMHVNFKAKGMRSLICLKIWLQNTRTTYDNILRLVKDPEVCEPIRFLRQREIVHFQRFGEGLRLVLEELDSKNFYMCNPEFDPGCGK